MTRLSDYAFNINSQFGEDGMIEHIFNLIGEGDKTCVEYGAGDGQSCSQTANLWRERGWKAVLVEPDVGRYEALEGNALPFGAICVRKMLAIDGDESISQLLIDHKIEQVDFLSIDIDGDDYFHLRHLKCRPRVISVEFNPTIPPHMELRQTEPGGTFGASARSLISVAEALGYAFVGASYCNVFFVLRPEAGPFQGYVTDLGILFPPEQYTYAVTDFAGRTTLCGQPLPWGAREPYVRPLTASTNLFPATDSPQQVRRGFESIWGPCRWLTPDGMSPERFDQVLNEGNVLVCVDLWNANIEAMGWMWVSATDKGYEVIFHARVLGLVRKDAL